MIPQGKTTAQHDHPILSKEPVPSPEHSPRYGEAYEHQRKEALHGSKASAGLAPKQPYRENISPVSYSQELIKKHRKPCSAYGEINRCEGMTCEADEDCASQCCGQLTHNGILQCHALIEGSFCPRALAPIIDYSSYQDDEVDSHRNDLLYQDEKRKQ